MNPAYKTLIAPYGTRSAACDGRYAAQLERLEVDYIAYQDEVGVRKTQVEELPGIYERLKAVHDQVGRSRLWADVEAFQFEGEVYHSPLLPAPPQRLRQQLEAVSPYVEKPDLSVSGAAECSGHICFLRPSRFRGAVPRLGGVAGRGSL